jgi:hypothetical protein
VVNEGRCAVAAAHRVAAEVGGSRVVGVCGAAQDVHRPSKSEGRTKYVALRPSIEPIVICSPVLERWQRRVVAARW